MKRIITRVGIIGGGELGQALGRALRRKDIDVQFYDKIEERSTVNSLEELVLHNTVLLLCVPSWVTREVARAIHESTPGGRTRVVVSASKGVERHFITIDQVLGQELEESNFVYGLLYGPMVAEELAVGRQAAAVLALSDMSWFDVLHQLLLKAKISTMASSDLQGLGTCGVLRNVYAIAFGMSDGLHLGDNAKGKLAVVVLNEMKRVLIHLETDPLLAEGLAGLGDLITTGMNESSFNYRIGKTIAEGIADEGIKSEGLTTLKELGQKIELARYPLLETLDGVVFRQQPVTLLEELLIKM